MSDFFISTVDDGKFSTQTNIDEDICFCGCLCMCDCTFGFYYQSNQLNEMQHDGMQTVAKGM
jgi:hypothetical protein